MDPKERIIVALDASDFQTVGELIYKLKPYVGCFKVGLEFMQFSWNQLLSCDEHRAKHGLEALRFIFAEMQGKVFWDGKFNDIPNTVAGAVRNTRAMGVKFFNVHALSGIDAVRKAVKNKGDAKLLVVTVLTSLQFADLWNIGLGRCRNVNCRKYATTEWSDKFVSDLVENMTMWAKGYGADGVICSPQELPLITKYGMYKNFIKVVPGVRPSWAAAGDQKRVMTPGDAIRAGADYLVIGRPITEASDPVESAQRITEEIYQAEKEAGK